MERWLEVLVAVTSVILLVGMPLLMLYLAERMKNIAREQTDKFLADQRHQHELLLASRTAEHQRRTHESGLYTHEQHRVYAKLYRLFREASDQYRGLIGLTSSPDFTKLEAIQVREYLDRREVKGGDAQIVLREYEEGDKGEAARMMTDLYYRLNQRDTERAFTHAKNFEARYDLYLSDPVRAKLDEVRSRMAAVLVCLQWGDDEPHSGREAYDKRKEMESAIDGLFNIMRDELRFGSSLEGTNSAASPTVE